MCHCQRRGGQLLLGRAAHLHVYEHGGAAQVGAAPRRLGAAPPRPPAGLQLHPPRGPGRGAERRPSAPERVEGQSAGVPARCARQPCSLPCAQVAGVHSQVLPDLPDGTFDLEQLELLIREAHGSRYHPRPELICLENTHSTAGGRVLPLPYLQQVGPAASSWQDPQGHPGLAEELGVEPTLAPGTPGVPPSPAAPLPPPGPRAR